MVFIRGRTLWMRSRQNIDDDNNLVHDPSIDLHEDDVMEIKTKLRQQCNNLELVGGNDMWMRILTMTLMRMLTMIFTLDTFIKI